MAIEGFNGQYRWLSNFWPADIIVDGVIYPTVEHAYVAAKSAEPLTPEDLEWFLKLTPAQAKRVGRMIDLRSDWEDIKLDVMLNLTRKKYSEDNPTPRAWLLATGDEYLEETNHWGDTFWGVCNGEGLNWLGHTIMAVRDEIRQNSG